MHVHALIFVRRKLEINYRKSNKLWNVTKLCCAAYMKKPDIKYKHIRLFSSISKLINHHFIETLWHIGVRMNENS